MAAPLVPLLAAGGVLAGGKILGGVSDIIGGNKAADALKRAQRGARSDLTTGFNEAKGYQQPIYDAALGNYSNLSDRYASGAFSNPEMTPYQFDPQSVFQDPEYQASIRAGTEAINSGANKKGMLFSGINNRDLHQFGQDTFARRSDELWRRGVDATNTAFNQNAQSRLTDFNMGNTLAQPLTGTAGQLTNLAVDQGTALADNTLGSGQIRAGNILRTSRALGDMAGDVAGIGADAILGRGKFGVNQPKSRL